MRKMNILDNVKRILRHRESSTILVTLLFAAVLYVSNPRFLSQINLFGILYYISQNTIMLGALTIILVSGCFDLSVGSVLAFSGILSGVLMVKVGLPVPVAIVLTIIAAACIGLINGVLVGYAGINPFVVTLATWFIFISGKYIINNGNHIYGLPESFNMLARTKVLGLPMIVIIAFASLILFELLLRRNVFFRKNYFIGGNETAANLVGINVAAMKTINYMIMAVMASIAGMISSARFGTAYTTAGTDTAFILAIAVIIGGASLYGGRGTVLGSFTGMLFMALVYNAIVLYGVVLYWNYVIIGGIIIIAVALDTIIEKRKSLIAD